MLKLSPDKHRYVFEAPTCHSNLNQYGKLSLSMKMQPYRSVHHSQIISQTVATEPSLPSRQTQTQTHTHTQNKETLSKLLLSPPPPSYRVNPQLERSINLVKEMGLFGDHKITHVKYEGHIKIPTVHNDYHNRATNGGYSRSKTGGIYPK